MIAVTLVSITYILMVNGRLMVAVPYISIYGFTIFYQPASSAIYQSSPIAYRIISYYLTL